MATAENGNMRAFNLSDGKEGFLFNLSKPLHEMKTDFGRTVLVKRGEKLFCVFADKDIFISASKVTDLDRAIKVLDTKKAYPAVKKTIDGTDPTQVSVVVDKEEMQKFRKIVKKINGEKDIIFYIKDGMAFFYNDDEIIEAKTSAKDMPVATFQQIEEWDEVYQVESTIFYGTTEYIRGAGKEQPSFLEKNEISKIINQKDILEKIVKVTDFTMENETLHKALEGVHINTTKKGLDIVATDSKVVSISTFEDITTEIHATIHARSLTKGLKEVSFDQHYITNQKVTLEYGDHRVLTQIITSKFPDYNRFFSVIKDMREKVKIEKKDMHPHGEWTLFEMKDGLLTITDAEKQKELAEIKIKDKETNKSFNIPSKQLKRVFSGKTIDLELPQKEGSPAKVIPDEHTTIFLMTFPAS